MSSWNLAKWMSSFYNMHLVLGISWDNEMLGHTSKIGHVAFLSAIWLLTLLYPWYNLEGAPSLGGICGGYEESSQFLQFKCLFIASYSSASTRWVVLLNYTSVKLVKQQISTPKYVSIWSSKRMAEPIYAQSTL